MWGGLICEGEFDLLGGDPGGGVAFGVSGIFVRDVENRKKIPNSS